MLFRIDPTPYRARRCKALEAQLAGDARAPPRELRRAAASARDQRRHGSAVRAAARPRAQAGRAVPRTGGQPVPATASPRAGRSRRARARGAARHGRRAPRRRCARRSLGATVGRATSRATSRRSRPQLDERALGALRRPSIVRAGRRHGRSTCSCARARSSSALPISPAMTFVEDEHQVIALYHAERAAQGQAGRRGRVRA